MQRRPLDKAIDACERIEKVDLLQNGGGRLLWLNCRQYARQIQVVFHGF